MQTQKQWPLLGVFDRWIATRWKESSRRGMIEITSERSDERTVHLRVSSGGAPMGEVRFRFETPGQGRSVKSNNGDERCDVALTYDSVGMTYLPDDPKKRVYRAG